MKSFLAILAVSVISVAFCCHGRQPMILCGTDAYCQASGWESCKLMPNSTYGICQGRMANICSDDEFCVKSGFGLNLTINM
ncbi:unnamed protein product, partial [Mesorhabditis belari]|uniref:Uncharacterized protein n=1 Tax=Mesorhabditis belari TaxID=2138241 RepID=A0AAF3F9S7_9BILA